MSYDEDPFRIPVNEEGDVVVPDGDEIEAGFADDLEYVYADEIDGNAEASEEDQALAAARTEYDRLVSEQLAWDDYCDRLDVNLPSHDRAYATTEQKIGPRPEIPDELQALFEKPAHAELPDAAALAPEKVSARSIIEGLRVRQLAACETEADRIALLAKFAAQDAKRKKGPMA